MVLFFLIASLISFAIFLITFLHARKLKNLPPGPRGLPIIGNLHQLQQPFHRTFHSLSQTYGQVFSLRFGSRLVVVVSSSSAAQECFTKNDIVLANRPQFLVGKYISYNNTTVLNTSYGDHWRNLRRILSLEVLSSHRLNSFLDLRRDEAMRMVQKLARAASTCGDGYANLRSSQKLARDSNTCEGGYANVEELARDSSTCEDGYGKVEDPARDSSTCDGDGYARVAVRSLFSEMTFNTVMRMISGKRYYGEDCDVSDVEEARVFREIIKELVMVGGTNNPRDFIGLLGWFDFDGFEKRLDKTRKRTDAFLQGLIDEHRDGRKYGNNATMIDHLLTQQLSQPEYYTDQIIKGLILVILLAGTDTSAVTLEWAMSNLLNHPEILKKAKHELDTYIGQDRLVDEADISKLPYIQNIVNEALRLHPAAPLLVPHVSSEDCTIDEYNIPRNTIVLVNAWAIHRDPELWSDPFCFKPERFEKEGETNKLLSFGLGRRACPGANLAQRTMGLTLALLIQCFEWKRTSEEEIDMTEVKGITVSKKIPLEAMCKLRQPLRKKDIL